MRTVFAKSAGSCFTGGMAARPTVGSKEWWEAQANRRPPLNTARIVEAAVRLVETDGADALTMRRLAAAS